MLVELDAFSGRPNPAWQLDEAQTAEFLSRVRALRPTQEGAPRDGLGYRGIIVRAPPGTAAGFDVIVCSGGVVVSRTGDQELTFEDRERNLERWLLHTSRGKIEEGLRTAALQDLASGT